MAQKTNYQDDYILITGASAGIGAALAKAFADKGFSLVLTARRKEQLDALAEEITGLYDVKVEVLISDLSEPEAANKLFAQTQAKNLKISGLVNNAGYGLLGGFHDYAMKEYEDMLQVMLVSCVSLSHLYTPDMIKRGYGWILNVASLTALVPASAGAPLYSPIKKFLLDFSQSHGEELKPKGVHVTALCPGFTRTEFLIRTEKLKQEAEKIPFYMWMESDIVAKQGVEAVLRGDSFYINGRVNRFLALLGKLLPDRMGRWIMRNQ